MKEEEERQAGKSPFPQVRSHCRFYSERKQSSHTRSHLSFLQEPVLTWSQGTVFRLEEDHKARGAVVPKQNFCLLMSSTMVMSTGSVKYILCKMRQLWSGGNNDLTELSKDQMRPLKTGKATYICIYIYVYYCYHSIFLALNGRSWQVVCEIV